MQKLTRDMARITAVAALALSGATPAYVSAQILPQHSIYPGLASAFSGELIPYDDGALIVPERHETNSGKPLLIRFIRLRSTAKSPADPIFILTGGPGGSGIDDFLKDRDIQSEILFYRGLADVVVFDQRGSAGHSLPRLDCPESLNLPLDQELTSASYREALRGIANRCKAAWVAEGVDLGAYNTIENVEDVDALRKALGYGKISLVGGSYGSHLSIATMRYRPEIVARAMLHGLEGPDSTYDVPSETLQDLTRISKAAEQSPTLRGFIPQGGLLAALQEVENRLTRKPVTISITLNGKVGPLVIGKVDIQILAMAGAHQRTDLRWAADVIEMYRGDFNGIAQRVIDNRRLVLDGAMYYMFDCASGISDERKARILADPAQGLLGDINADYFAVCDIWNSPDLGAKFRSNLKADIPTLIFSGDWDISTPLANAKAFMPGLSHGSLVIVEGGTHDTVGDLRREWLGMNALSAAFLTGKAVTIPDHIALPHTTFVAPRVRKP